MFNRGRGQSSSACLFRHRQFKEAIVKHCLMLCATVFFAFSLLPATDVSGNQSGTWTLANSPYNIIGDITIPSGVWLTIEPGVQVYAMGDFRITAMGALHADGNEADSIRFMSGQASPDALWKGIRLESTTQGSTIGFCYIEKAEYGVNSINSPALIHHSRFNLNQKGMQLYGIGAADPAEVIVSHCLIERSIQNGILVAQNSNAVILANELRYNGTGTQYMASIQLSNQSTGGSNSPVIHSNHIHHNHKQGITAWDIVGANAIQPEIYDNLIEYNLTGIYLLNASGYVHDNIIAHNFIPGDANSGAGVMVAGATSAPYFERNEIYGNFTGFYIGTNAQPCLGDLSIYHAWAQGENQIYGNIDESNLLHSVYTYSYTNPNLVIKAENNYWGTDDPAQIAVGINDHNDSASLPTVDFEPYLMEPDIVAVTGSVAYNGIFNLSNHRIQFVDSSTGDIIYEYALDTPADFSFSVSLTEPFHVVVIADAVVVGRTLYGTPGGLAQPQSLDPGEQSSFALGTIEIEDTPPPRHQQAGAPQMVGDNLCYPVYNSFFVYHWEYINWLFQQGDYLYIRRHTRYNDAANIEFYLPGMVMWDKVANVQHDDLWTRTEIMDDSGTQRQSTFQARQVADEGFISNRVIYSLILQRDAADNSLICIRQYMPDFRRLYHYDGDYVWRAETIVSNLWDPYLQEGAFWHYMPILTVYQPTYLCFDFPENQMQNHSHLTLYWQAPMDDGSFDWTGYRIYNHGQLFAEVPFGQNSWHTESLDNHSYYLFTVCATDGTNESALTNSVSIYGVANDDPAATPLAMSVQPNPASLSAHGGVEISLRSGKELQGRLTVYNLRGQAVRVQNFSGAKDLSWRWDLRDDKGQLCASGVYFLRAEFAGEKSLSRRLAIFK